MLGNRLRASAVLRNRLRASAALGNRLRASAVLRNHLRASAVLGNRRRVTSRLPVEPARPAAANHLRARRGAADPLTTRELARRTRVKARLRRTAPVRARPGNRVLMLVRARVDAGHGTQARLQLVEAEYRLAEYRLAEYRPGMLVAGLLPVELAATAGSSLRRLRRSFRAWGSQCSSRRPGSTRRSRSPSRQDQDAGGSPVGCPGTC